MEDEAQLWQDRYLQLLEKVAALEARIVKLEAENLTLKAENLLLKSENRDLREKLNTNSSNSSKPPSQDPFRKFRTTQPSGKKPGGQPGHPGHRKKVYPQEQVTKTVHLKPDSCARCGSVDFDEIPVSVECRQTLELPVIQPEVTQYNVYTCKCSACGKHVRPRSWRSRKGLWSATDGFFDNVVGGSGSY